MKCYIEMLNRTRNVETWMLEGGVSWHRVESKGVLKEYKEGDEILKSRDPIDQKYAAQNGWYWAAKSKKTQGTMSVFMGAKKPEPGVEVGTFRIAK